MQARQIATDIHYPVPDYQQVAYPAADTVTLPVTEHACRTVVSLPCFPGLSAADVERVIDAVTGYFEDRK
jgi:dTDP-4-amino-4,6-dideoxygalactose transaminase